MDTVAGQHWATRPSNATVYVQKVTSYLSDIDQNIEKNIKQLKYLHQSLRDLESAEELQNRSKTTKNRVNLNRLRQDLTTKEIRKTVRLQQSLVEQSLTKPKAHIVEINDLKEHLIDTLWNSLNALQELKQYGKEVQRDLQTHPDNSLDTTKVQQSTCQINVHPSEILKENCKLKEQLRQSQHNLQQHLDKKLARDSQLHQMHHKYRDLQYQIQYKDSYLSKYHKSLDQRDGRLQALRNRNGRLESQLQIEQTKNSKLQQEIGILEEECKVMASLVQMRINNPAHQSSNQLGYIKQPVGHKTGTKSQNMYHKLLNETLQPCEDHQGVENMIPESPSKTILGPSSQNAINRQTSNAKLSQQRPNQHSEIQEAQTKFQFSRKLNQNSSLSKHNTINISEVETLQQQNNDYLNLVLPSYPSAAEAIKSKSEQDQINYIDNNVVQKIYSEHIQAVDDTIKDLLHEDASSRTNDKFRNSLSDGAKASTEVATEFKTNCQSTSQNCKTTQVIQDLQRLYQFKSQLADQLNYSCPPNQRVSRTCLGQLSPGFVNNQNIKSKSAAQSPEQLSIYDRKHLQSESQASFNSTQRNIQTSLKYQIPSFEFLGSVSKQASEELASSSQKISNQDRIDTLDNIFLKNLRLTNVQRGTNNQNTRQAIFQNDVDRRFAYDNEKNLHNSDTNNMNTNLSTMAVFLNDLQSYTIEQQTLGCSNLSQPNAIKSGQRKPPSKLKQSFKISESFNKQDSIGKNQQTAGISSVEKELSQSEVTEPSPIIRQQKYRQPLGDTTYQQVTQNTTKRAHDSKPKQYRNTGEDKQSIIQLANSASTIEGLAILQQTENNATEIQGTGHSIKQDRQNSQYSQTKEQQQKTNDRPNIQNQSYKKVPEQRLTKPCETGSQSNVQISNTPQNSFKYQSKVKYSRVPHKQRKMFTYNRNGHPTVVGYIVKPYNLSIKNKTRHRLDIANSQVHNQGQRQYIRPFDQGQNSVAQHRFQDVRYNCIDNHDQRSQQTIKQSKNDFDQLVWCIDKNMENKCINAVEKGSGKPNGLKADEYGQEFKCSNKCEFIKPKHSKQQDYKGSKNQKRYKNKRVVVCTKRINRVQLQRIINRQLKSQQREPQQQIVTKQITNMQPKHQKDSKASLQICQSDQVRELSEGSLYDWRHYSNTRNTIELQEQIAHDSKLNSKQQASSQQDQQVKHDSDSPNSSLGQQHGFHWQKLPQPISFDNNTQYGDQNQANLFNIEKFNQLNYIQDNQSQAQEYDRDIDQHMTNRLAQLSGIASKNSQQSGIHSTKITERKLQFRRYSDSEIGPSHSWYGDRLHTQLNCNNNQFTAHAEPSGVPISKVKTTQNPNGDQKSSLPKKKILYCEQSNNSITPIDQPLNLVIDKSTNTNEMLDMQQQKLKNSLIMATTSQSQHAEPSIRSQQDQQNQLAQVQQCERTDDQQFPQRNSAQSIHHSVKQTNVDSGNSVAPLFKMSTNTNSVEKEYSESIYSNIDDISKRNIQAHLLETTDRQFCKSTSLSRKGSSSDQESQHRLNNQRPIDEQAKLQGVLRALDFQRSTGIPSLNKSKQVLQQPQMATNSDIFTKRISQCSVAMTGESSLSEMVEENNYSNVLDDRFNKNENYQAQNGEGGTVQAMTINPLYDVQSALNSLHNKKKSQINTNGFYKFKSLSEVTHFQHQETVRNIDKFSSDNGSCRGYGTVQPEHQSDIPSQEPQQQMEKAEKDIPKSMGHAKINIDLNQNSIAQKHQYSIKQMLEQHQDAQHTDQSIRTRDVIVMDGAQVKEQRPSQGGHRLSISSTFYDTQINISNGGDDLVCDDNKEHYNKPASVSQQGDIQNQSYSQSNIESQTNKRKHNSIQQQGKGRTKSLQIVRKNKLSIQSRQKSASSYQNDQQTAQGIKERSNLLSDNKNLFSQINHDTLIDCDKNCRVDFLGNRNLDRAAEFSEHAIVSTEDTNVLSSAGLKCDILSIVRSNEEFGMSFNNQKAQNDGILVNNLDRYQNASLSSISSYPVSERHSGMYRSNNEIQDNQNNSFETYNRYLSNSNQYYVVGGVYSNRIGCTSIASPSDRSSIGNTDAEARLYQSNENLGQRISKSHVKNIVNKMEQSITQFKSAIEYNSTDEKFVSNGAQHCSVTETRVCKEADQYKPLQNKSNLKQYQGSLHLQYKPKQGLQQQNVTQNEQEIVSSITNKGPSLISGQESCLLKNEDILNESNLCRHQQPINQKQRIVDTMLSDKRLSRNSGIRRSSSRTHSPISDRKLSFVNFSRQKFSQIIDQPALGKEDQLIQQLPFSQNKESQPQHVLQQPNSLAIHNEKQPQLKHNSQQQAQTYHMDSGIGSVSQSQSRTSSPAKYSKYGQVQRFQQDLDQIKNRNQLFRNLSLQNTPQRHETQLLEDISSPNSASVSAFARNIAKQFDSKKSQRPLIQHRHTLTVQHIPIEQPELTLHPKSQTLTDQFQPTDQVYITKKGYNSLAQQQILSDVKAECIFEYYCGNSVGAKQKGTFSIKLG